jgi:hypothetical protein
LTDLTTERARQPLPPQQTAALPGVPAQPTIGTLSVRPDGVALSRLLALARITRAQALEIEAGVLEEAARRPEPGNGHSGGARITLDQVVVGADGRIGFCPAPGGARNGGPPAPRSPGDGVGAVLAAVAAARPPDRADDPPQDDVLDRALAELPVAGVAAAARLLQEATPETGRETVRAELAALVGAIRTELRPGPGAAPTGTAAGPGTEAPARRGDRGRGRTARRRIGAWLLSVLVLAGVVAVEVAVLRDKIAADIGQLLDAGRGGTAAAASAVPDGRPITPPAPAAAGAVTGVDLRALRPCAPGAPCALRLLVQVEPGAGPQVVTWTYRLIDRCTQASGTAPGGTVTVPARGRSAVLLRIVPVPDLPAVAVVAVTDRPATAASPPVLIGSCAHHPQGK